MTLLPIIPINYPMVLLGALSNMVMGMLWYGPLFGKVWMKEMGISSKDMDKSKIKGMWKLYVMAFVGSILMSYVLAHATVFAFAYLNASGVLAGITSAFWNWLGFVVPVTLAQLLWEGKSFKLWMINVSYYLVVLMMMGVLISL